MSSQNLKQMSNVCLQLYFQIKKIIKEKQNIKDYKRKTEQKRLKAQSLC